MLKYILLVSIFYSSVIRSSDLQELKSSSSNSSSSTPSVSLSIVSINKIEDHFVEFNENKSLILEKMNEIIDKSKDIELSTIAEIIDKEGYIDKFPVHNLTSEDFESDLCKFLSHLLNTNITPENIIDNSGESSATTYLYREKESKKVLRALKIYDGECKSDYLCELLSCLYTRNQLNFLNKNKELIDFSEVQLSFIFKSPNSVKYVLIFDGASGKDVNSIIENLDSLKEIIFISKAFALLHEKTKFEKTNHKNTNDDALRHIEELLTKKTKKNFLYKEVKHPEKKESSYDLHRSVIHRDAHIGNIIYDSTIPLVTFIDYETTFESLIHGSDPIRDIGCFMISVWNKILTINQDNDKLKNIYADLNKFRNTFLQMYINERKLSNIESNKNNILNQLKLHMWGYAGYLVSEQFTTIKELKDETIGWFLNQELIKDWQDTYHVNIIDKNENQSS